MRNNSGQVMIVFILFLLPLCFFLLSVASTTRMVRSRIKLQNSADAAALSAAEWQAKALNQLAETNLVIEASDLLQTYIDEEQGPAPVRDAKKALLEAEKRRMKEVQQDIQKRAPRYAVMSAVRNGMRTLIGNERSGTIANGAREGITCFSARGGWVMDKPVSVLAWSKQGIALASGKAISIANTPMEPVLVPDFRAQLTAVDITQADFNLLKDEYHFLFKGMTFDTLCKIAP